MIITPNNRLAASLIRSQVTDICQTPNILPWQGFINQLWDKYIANNQVPELNDDLTISYIWQKIVDYDYPVASVQQAYNLIINWQIGVEELEQAATNLEHQLFCKWVQDYQEYCKQHEIIDSSTQLSLLVDNLDLIQTKLELVNFDTISPLQKKLLDKAEHCYTYENHQVTNIQRIVCISEDHEIINAAKWASQQQGSTGIIIPNLPSKRDFVEYTFNQYVEQYNLSAPIALDNYPMITCALNLVKLLDRFNYQVLSDVLRSSYISGDVVSRAKLDFELRSIVTEHTDLQAISKIIPEPFKEIILQTIKLQVSRKTTSGWRTLFLQLIKIWGWPGNQLEEQELHLYTSFHNLLAKYVQVGNIVGKQELQGFIRTISDLASKIPFLPKKPECNIQVLDLLEGAGLSFDNLLVTGMDSSSWPMAPDPNPFIPHTLQQKYNIPRSSPSRELEVAKAITARFTACTKQQVLFSYPQTIAGNPTNCSQLIYQYPEIKVELSAKSPTPVSLEYVADQYGHASTNGDASLLQMQSQCPFKAYAKHKLAAFAPAYPSDYLTPVQRGIIIHKVLELLWSQVKTRDNLLSNQHLVTEIVLQIFEELHYDREYLQIEQQRTIEVILAWCKIELQRENFVVKHIEQRKTIKIADIEFKFRVDRIDQLDDGRELIIDYKTGNVSVAGWFGDRLLQPQLPVYACLQVDIAGIAFASLKLNNMRYVGVVAEQVDNLTPFNKVRGNKHETWEQQLDAWRNNFNTLAKELKSGLATVTPINLNVCNSCDLHSLCRIYEST